ncbi:Putative leucine-rich repeat domain superfamily [Septoria linicola]|uniref:Leucine-rich repeat domain superfamily n=1 Tax=Septoria linicola TaxID=215465 RepID=A0A9Q9AW31_9PEZI|nr:putative leucine-rich repeat domain superfamily [Septoria linicola]USW53022.1 Putative leucine-rich repeat domain superfamily [Septoria linicola]
MGPSTLLSLATELQDKIVACLKTYQDLKAVCLSCKQLNDVTTPHLYPTVKINAYSDTSSFLEPEHRGHVHVRKIVFLDPQSVEDHGLDNALLRQILLLLPRNLLRQILTPEDFVLEPITLTTIFTQQKMLQNLTVGRPESYGDTEIMLRNARVLHNLRVLFLGHLDNEVSLELYNTLLRENASELERLQLYDTSFRRDSGGNDRIGSGGLFMSLFGAHVRQNQQLPKLKDFSADLLDLRKAACAWTQVIPFETLRFLTLVDCEGLSPLFVELTRRFHLSGAKLASFTCRSTYEDCSLPTTELESMLRSFSGLEYLELEDYCKDVTFDCASLVNHFPTLRHLRVCRIMDSASGTSVHVVPLETMQVLSLALPDFSTNASEGTEWGTFGTMLDLVTQLPKLSVLHLQTWPMASSSTGTKPSIPKVVDYEANLNKMASRVMSRFDAAHPEQASELKLVAFGDARGDNTVATEELERLDMRGRRFFVRRVHTSTLESDAAVAVPIQLTDIKSHVPDFSGMCESHIDLGFDSSGYCFNLG